MIPGGARTRRLAICVLLIGVLVVAGCSRTTSGTAADPSAVPSVEPETVGSVHPADAGLRSGPDGIIDYYALDLSTPEAGAEAIIDAWTRRDFILAHQLFDPEAQRLITRNIGFLALDAWALHFDGLGVDTEEHRMSASMFGLTLIHAAEIGSQRVELAGARLDGDSQPVSTVDGRSAQDLGIRLSDGRQAVLRMVPSPSRRWRVLRIGLSSLDGELPDRVVVARGCEADPRVEVIAPAACEDLDRIVGTTGSLDVTARDLCLIMQDHLAAVVGLAAFDGDLAVVGDQLVATTCPGDPSLLFRYEGRAFSPGAAVDATGKLYGALPLESPTEGADTFLRLFEAQLFAPLSHVIDPVGQADVRPTASWLSPSAAEVVSGMPNLGTEMGAGSVPAFFDSIMRIAWEADDFLVDPRGAQLGESQPLQEFGDAQSAVVIEATSERHPEGLGFVVVESSTGRWRVRQVASPATAIDAEAGLFVVGE